jgi:hypothetical protein
MDLFTPGRVIFLLPHNYRLPPEYHTDDPHAIAKILDSGAEYIRAKQSWLESTQEAEHYASVIEKHKKEVEAARDDIERKYKSELALVKQENQSLSLQIAATRERLQSDIEKESARRSAPLQEEINRLCRVIEGADARSDVLLKREEESAARIAAEYNKRCLLIEEQLSKSEGRRRELEDLLLQKTRTLASSQKRGAEGEIAFEELAVNAGFHDIKSTGKEIHMCDYRATIDSIEVFFEVKNHESSIANDQVLKFIRDMNEHPEIGAGIFIAMNAPLPGLKRGRKFVVEWLDQYRPLIYVGEFMKEDPQIFLELIHQYLKMIAHMRSVYEDTADLEERLNYEGKIRRATQSIESLAERMRFLQNKLAADKQAALSAYESTIFIVKTIREQIGLIIDIFTGKHVDISGADSPGEGSAVASEFTEITPSMIINAETVEQKKKPRSKRTKKEVLVLPIDPQN